MDFQSRDLTTVSRFITEGTAYVVDDKIKHNRRVFVLSYHLKGKAYDFYTQKVSMNNEQWSQQRDKLKRTYQNSKNGNNLHLQARGTLQYYWFQGVCKLFFKYINLVKDLYSPPSSLLIRKVLLF